MSIATVVTRGYGSFGDIFFVTLRGYSPGEIPEPTDIPNPNGSRLLIMKPENRTLHLR